MNVGVVFACDSKFEGWTKLKLVRQQTRLKNIPVSIAL